MLIYAARLCSLLPVIMTLPLKSGREFRRSRGGVALGHFCDQFSELTTV